jgi:hypothetical protein
MDGDSILAKDLSKAADHHTSFAAYAPRGRSFVANKRRKARRFIRMFVPGSRLGVQASYLTMKRMFRPLLARCIGPQFGIDRLLRAT